MSIMVATQSGFLNETTETLEAMCTRNNYGRVGELVRGRAPTKQTQLYSPLLPEICQRLAPLNLCLVFSYLQCLPCPQGAYCDGKLADPISLPGWCVLGLCVSTG